MGRVHHLASKAKTGCPAEGPTQSSQDEQVLPSKGGWEGNGKRNSLCKERQERGDTRVGEAISLSLSVWRGFHSETEDRRCSEQGQ